jgi:TrmH family RNA methyltransferase
VVLDRLQDAGNVGAILRSASAFGFKQIVAIKGTAGLWSPKVLRAGMGAHFGLQLIESANAENLQSLKMPLLGTDVHEGPYLHDLLKQGGLTQKCAWVMGHEGQGPHDAARRFEGVAKLFALMRVAQTQAAPIWQIGIQSKVSLNLGS